MIEWPDDLPQFVRRTDFHHTHGDGVLRTKTEAGPGKARRRYSSDPDRMTCSITVDRQGLARFRRFYQEETKNGSLPFVMRDQEFDSCLLADILTEAGAPIEVVSYRIVMFAEAPSETSFGMMFSVGMSLSLMP